jgi:hypothetical protein
MEVDDNLVPESQGTNEPSKALQDMSMPLGPNEQDLSDVSKVFTGESVASFRALLKRWALHEGNILNDGTRLTTHIRCAQPYLRGNAPDAVHQASGGTLSYNYVNTLLYHWVRYAFAGHRGSMRWKFLPRTYGNTLNDFNLYAQRNPLGIGAEYVNATATNNSFVGTFGVASRQVQTVARLATSTLGATAFDGVAYTHRLVNPVMEIEVPYYSQFRFSPGKTASYTGVEVFDPTYRVQYCTNLSNQSSCDYWTSTGEDFQVYMWTGLPRMYYEAVPPPV